MAGARGEALLAMDDFESDGEENALRVFDIQGFVDIVDEGITLGGDVVLSLKDLLSFIVALALEKMIGTSVISALLERDAEG